MSDTHDFWDSQPVPKMGEAINEEGPVEVVTLDKVQREPYSIATSFEWWTPKISDDGDLQQIYELLRDNYVEDSGSMFRFNYSKDFLKWALAPPGYIHDWHVAVRKKSDKKILAFISGIPMTTKMGNTTKRICEINFLCISKNLRDKRLAPILIKEVTRRVNLCDIWQAVYTAGKVIPTPFCSASYHHRSLNPEKLIAVNFSRIPRQYEKFSKPMEIVKKMYSLPAKVATNGLRTMEKKDVPQVAALLNAHVGSYRVAPVFSEEEVQHWIMPRKGVVFTYVVEKEGVVTDFVSFYSLPSTIIGHPKYDQLNAAYVYYYAAKTVPLKVLMNDMLIKARDEKFDVCNCVNILRNEEMLTDLKYMPGDGSLHYYFYNWKFPSAQPGEVSLVML